MSSDPTLYLIGGDELPRVRQFLDLGAVVVIAPDRQTLDRWQAANRGASAEPPSHRSIDGLHLDLEGRRVRWNGEDLALTPLEFRVFVAMAARPGRAWSFRELRQAGWGPDLAHGIDVFAVRSVIQRLRRKLRRNEVGLSIESVRSFGFRVSIHLEHEGAQGRTPLAAVP